MAVSLVFNGHVTSEGKLRLDRKTDFHEHVDALRGEEIVLTLKKKRAQRSIDQNAFWWAVPVKILAEHCGYTDAQMHYALLGECFGYKQGPTGHPLPNVPSSSELTVEEFSTLIEWVLTWAPTELGVKIPAPGEVDF